MAEDAEELTESKNETKVVKEKMQKEVTCLTGWNIFMWDAFLFKLKFNVTQKQMKLILTIHS